MIKHTVFGSLGTNLQFTNTSMYKEYQDACIDLDRKFYRRIREQDGIWASNQGKFVKDASELNNWDSRYMENLVG